MNDPSTFEVLNLYKYFQNFIKYIGIDIAISSFVIMVKDLSSHLQSSHEEAFARMQLIFPLRSKLVWCNVPNVSGDCKILHS